MRVINKKKTNKLFVAIVQNIKNNIKIYLLVVAILIIGIALGVFFVNGMKDTQINEVENYINNFISALKSDSKIDLNILLKDSIINNTILTVFIWFVASTIIGIPLVLGMVLIKGFCFGYTISALVAVLGTQKGFIFCITAITLQNIIEIPCIIELAVSGIKLYKSIIKDKRKENVKVEILRHTLFSVMIYILLILASFIETYISANLFEMCIKYF